MKTFYDFKSLPFFSQSSPIVAKGKHFLPKTPLSNVDVGFSFCLVLIVWLKQVQDLRNRIKFLSFHKLSPVNLTWLSQVYGENVFPSNMLIGIGKYLSIKYYHPKF